MRIPICMLALLAFTGLVYAEDPDDQAPPPSTTAAAPAPATPPAPPPKYHGFIFSGLLDGYITANQNHPISNLNQLQNFDIMWGQPLISLAKFTIDKSDSVLGFHVDTGLGETMRLIHAGDVAAQEHKSLRYFEQMYVIVKPKHTNGTEIDYGTFVTSAGAEVIESSSNWNYSRSLLFAWAIPYYHFGLKVTQPVNKVLTIGVQVVNPWNTTWGSHNMQNFGLTSAVVKGKVSWFTNYYVGDQKPQIGTIPNGGVRHLIDSTLLVNPTDKLSFYINGDYGRDNNATGGGNNEWDGIAGALRYQATKKIAFAGRVEYFSDPQGFETTVAQSLKEGTITGEYKFNGIFMARAEYRHDVSNQPFFDRGAQTAVSKDLTTVTLGVTANFGPWK
jgi:Putative beta-barrel porin-2, OmpL-like. bbp2